MSTVLFFFLRVLAPLRLGCKADCNYPFRAERAISFRFTRIVVAGNSAIGEKYYAYKKLLLFFLPSL